MALKFMPISKARFTQVCFVTTIVILKPSPSLGIHEDSHSPLIPQV